MNVLVLGGNRFIGAELVALLLAEKHEVTILALDPPSVEPARSVRFVQANRHALEELRSLFADQRFDAVFDNIAFRPEDVDGLLGVIGDRCGRYVLTGSVDIYPQAAPRQWRPEDGPLEPFALEGAPSAERYLRGKRGCERVLRASGIPFSVVRPAIVTGPKDPIAPRPRHWARDQAGAARSLHLPARVLDGQPILLPLTDRRIFQLAWVQDVARALHVAAFHPLAEGKAFNVAGDELWTHERLARALCEAAGHAPQIARVSDEDLVTAGLGGYDAPYGRGPRCSLASNQSLKALGWRPTPSRVWLPQLLNAVRITEMRPYYHLRAKEKSLARRLLSIRSGNGEVTMVAGPRADAAGKSPLPAAGHLPVDHYRNLDGMPLSSIGIGTHRGDADEVTDAQYLESLDVALEGGINVVDTAINYRAMRAERVVGRAVQNYIERGGSRQSVFVTTKGGFVPHDSNDSRTATVWVQEELVQPGFLDPADALVRHSLRKTWIEESLRRSLNNLGLPQIDAYLLHNPERFLVRMGSGFWRTLTETFSLLEDKVAEGRVRYYGLALWDAIRADVKSPSLLPLSKALECARLAAGGSRHHFRILEMPLNVNDASALRHRNQLVQGRWIAPLSFAAEHDMFVLASASVARAGAFGERSRSRLPAVPGPEDAYVRALQFTRSAPGVGSALVGMRRVEHVRSALKLSTVPRERGEDIVRLLL
jgi:aryl-alcohol dehydrogenase-like predicted oxidoreductase/nucleoside-diphosphate-sugar epimerase